MEALHSRSLSTNRRTGAYLVKISLILFLLYGIYGCGGSSNPPAPPPPDTTPNAFTFDDVTSAELSTEYTAEITVAGIAAAAAISVNNGEYSTDGGESYTSTAATVANNTAVTVRQTSSSMSETETITTLTVGGVSDEFNVTTGDSVPEQFTFTDVNDAILSTEYIAEITIQGIAINTSISIDGGEYSLDNGTIYTMDAGTVANDQVVRVRQTSSDMLETESLVTLIAGGVSDGFAVTTLADTAPPVVAVTFPPKLSMTEGDSLTLRGTASDALSAITSFQMGGNDVTIDSETNTWEVVVALVDGDNTFTFSATDAAGNTDANAAEVVVRKASLNTAFPNNTNAFSFPISIGLDMARNRVLVGDRDLDAIMAVDLSSGERGILSDSSSEDTAAPFNSPEGILVDSENDRLWVGDISIDAVFEVSLLDGSRSVLSSDTQPNIDFQFSSPREMVRNPNNSDQLFVADQELGIKLVDSTTGVRTVFSDEGRAEYPGGVPNNDNPFGIAKGLVLDVARNRLLSADQNINAIVGVSLADGAREYISDNTIQSGAPLLDDPLSIVLDSGRNRALIADKAAAAIIALDLETNLRSDFSNGTVPASINAFQLPEEIYYDGSLGYALVVDSGLDALLAVDLITGERVIMSKALQFIAQ